MKKILTIISTFCLVTSYGICDTFFWEKAHAVSSRFYKLNDALTKIKTSELKKLSLSQKLEKKLYNVTNFVDIAKSEDIKLEIELALKASDKETRMIAVQIYTALLCLNNEYFKAIELNFSLLTSIKNIDERNILKRRIRKLIEEGNKVNIFPGKIKLTFSGKELDNLDWVVIDVFTVGQQIHRRYAGAKYTATRVEGRLLKETVDDKSKITFGNLMLDSPISFNIYYKVANRKGAHSIDNGAFSYDSFVVNKNVKLDKQNKIFNLNIQIK